MPLQYAMLGNRFIGRIETLQRGVPGFIHDATPLSTTTDTDFQKGHAFEDCVGKPFFAV